MCFSHNVTYLKTLICMSVYIPNYMDGSISQEKYLAGNATFPTPLPYLNLSVE